MPVVHLDPRTKGGSGSGNFGHAGRPGEVGGSASSVGGGAVEESVLDAPPVHGSYAAGVPTMPADLNARVPAKLPTIEEARLRGRPTETAIVLDQTGHIIGEWTDHAVDSVNIPEGVDMTDAVFSHNHPADTAFSPNDAAVAAQHNIAEIRAVTSDGTFRLARRGSAWPRGIAMQAVAQAANVQKEFLAQIDKGTISIPEANNRHWTEVWKRVVAAQPDVVFAFEKVP